MLKLSFIRLPKESESVFFEKAWEQVLPAVREEVAAIRNKRVALRRLVGEVMVERAILEGWGLGRSAYVIARTKGGKPYVEGRRDIFFNVSHSGDYVVCVVSDWEVGVDIERRRKAPLDVARRYFHPGELSSLERLAESERNVRFFDYWSVKESFLKYVGTGLTHPLNSFRVEFLDNDVKIFEEDALLPVNVSACPVDEAYACYVCAGCAGGVEMQKFIW